MSNLEQAVSLKAELDALRPLDPEQEKRIWQKFRFDWNYHSNNIEGNSLTFGETKSLLLHNITAQGKPLKDHIEITGHNEAINALLDLTRGDIPLTESFLRGLHAMILSERYQVDAQTADGNATKKWVEVGQYKTAPNHVLTVTGEVFRFAEPIEVSGKMQQLMIDVNALAGKSDAEILVAAAEAHYEFVLIHPFDDGNGRMARLLMNLILIKYGFPPAIIKTEDKANYFSALRQADGGQLDEFVEYIGGRVAASLEIILAGARGEEIDEFDVKARQKILALERLLVTKGTHVTATRSKETVAITMETALLPLQAIVLRSLEKFSALLFSIKGEYHERTRDRGFSNSYSYSQALSLDHMQSAAESGKLVLRVLLTGVRSVGFFNSQKSWDLVISLFGDHVQIQCQDLELQLDLRYQTALSDDQARSVDQVLTKHAIQWLQDVTGIDVDKVLSG